jgi:hypothetical protein
MPSSRWETIDSWVGWISADASKTFKDSAGTNWRYELQMESSVRLWRDRGSPFLWTGTEQISASQFDGWAWQKPIPAS